MTWQYANGRWYWTVSGETINIAESNKAFVIYEDGDILYVCKATIGTAVADALWQIRKIDTSSGIVITWCDGNDLYDNTATDLGTVSGHTYS